MDAKEIFREAQILLMKGQHAESVDAFTRALDAGAEPFITHLSRGAAYLRMKEPDRAIEDFTSAADIDGRSARAYYYRGAAHMFKEDYEKAVDDLAAAIELKPDHGAAFFARGTCYAQMGMDEESARDIKTALSYSEVAVQGFVDTFGILRTQFDSVLALLSGGKRTDLTEEETAKIKKWLQEDEGT